MTWRKGGLGQTRGRFTRGGDVELGIATILLAVAILLTAIVVPLIGP
jgi:hypothetical protein